jgi:hypothetical protein
MCHSPRRLQTLLRFRRNWDYEPRLWFSNLIWSSVLSPMPALFRVVLFTVFVGFIVVGAFHIAKPAVIQRSVLRRMTRTPGADERFVRGPLFPWFARVVGALFVWVGFHGLQMLGVFRD